MGCGALGSVAFEEIAKKALATETPIELMLYDFDTVESPRNVASQNFRPNQVGKYKIDCLLDIAEAYGLRARGKPEKLGRGNILELMELEPGDIILDLVDNLPTRQLLWQTGLAQGAPVCHGAISQHGQGRVSWNYQAYDTFPLSPARLTEEQQASVATDKPQTLPPCELTKFRGLIVNTALATVEALFIFLGSDASGEFKALVEDGSTIGLITNWNSTSRGYEWDEKLTEQVEWNY